MAEKRTSLVGMMAANTRKRVESYKNLTNLSSEEGNAVDWNAYISASERKKILTNVKNDLASQNEEAYEAACVCVHLLANQAFLSQVDTPSQKSLFDIMIKTLKTTKDRKLTNRILQSLAKSRLKNEVYLSNLADTFDVLGDILNIGDLPVILVNDALQVILVVFNASPDASYQFRKAWFPCTFSKLFCPNFKVRRAALAVISRVGEAVSTISSPGARTNLIAMVLQDLKDKYCKDMLQILVSSHFDILQVWCAIVTLLDTELHSRRSLINSLLNVVEKAFKISNPEVRVDAFICWSTIIDNFALDKNTISNSRKLQLLLAPFRVINSKTEKISKTKLVTWWHLTCILSVNSCLVANFDQVVVPLLHFCFTNGSPSEGNKSGLGNRNLVMSGSVASPGRAFISLHTTCAEILAQLLATEDNTPVYKFSVEHIGEHVMSSALFIRHYALLMKCVNEAIQTLSFSDEQQNTIGVFLFCSLLTHIKGITAADVQKKDSVDVVRELFNMLSHIESHCEPGDSESQFLFKFFSLLTIGSLALPKRIFSSHQYHIAASSGGHARDIMSGTLSNHVITQLCRPALLHHSLSSIMFFKVWTAVLENSQPVTGKLRFLEATVQAMSVSAIPFLGPEHPLVVTRLWSSVLKQTLEHIEQTGAIEADEGEPDWSCIYSVLLFPVTHATEAFSCAQSTIYESIMDPWRRLWKKFAFFAKAIPTVEPNSEVEQMASTLLSLCQEKGTDEPPDVHTPMYLLVVDVLVLLTETFYYCNLGKGPQELSPSPAKAKKKPHPLHNLASCVELTSVLFEKAYDMVTRQRMQMADKLCQAAINMIEGISEAPMKYIQEFITQMVKMLSRCIKVNPAVVFDFNVEKKVVDLLGCFTGLIQLCITQDGVTEPLLEHLNTLELLFNVAFTSTNSKIKQEVQKLLDVSIASMSTAGLGVPLLFLEVQKKWDQVGVNDPESMEDFVQDTPKEKPNRKSVKLLEKFLGSSKKSSSPRNTTTPIKRKQKRHITDKEVQSAAVTSPPPTRFSLRMRKVQRRKSNNSSLSSPTSPRASAVTTPSTQDSSKWVATSAASSNSPLMRAVRVSRNANLPQNKEGKHIRLQSASHELEEKEKNETEGDVRRKTTSKPSNDSDPVVEVGAEPREIRKDCDKSNDVNGITTETEFESNAQEKSQSKKMDQNQKNSSSIYSEENGNESLGSCEVYWKGESSLGSSPSKAEYKRESEREGRVQKGSRGKFGKADEDLCPVLHVTSLEMHKLLSDRCLDKHEDPDYGFKIVAEQVASSPRSSQTITNQALERTPPAHSSARHKRINFMEVNVSPSIVKDGKIVVHKPEVKIINAEPMVKGASEASVQASDSEDEIPSSLEVNDNITRNSICASEKSNSEKTHLKEMLSVGVEQGEPMESSTLEGSSTGEKRKRILFSRLKDLNGGPKKRKRMEASTQNHNQSISSLDDSIIDLINSSSEEDPTDESKKVSANEVKGGSAKESKECSVKEVKECSTLDTEENSVEETKEGSTKESEEHSAKNIEGLANEAKEHLTKESKGGPTKESKEDPTKETKGILKSVRRTRSCPSQTSTEMEVSSKTKSAFSPKITRSGRKIVPPNKDMPEPMTPLKKSKRKLRQKDTSPQAENGGSRKSGRDTVDLNNSSSDSDENSQSLLMGTDFEIENVMEVDSPLSSPVEVRLLVDNKKKCEQMEDTAKEGEFILDDSVTIIDSDDESTSKGETLSSQSRAGETETSKMSSATRTGASSHKPSESQKLKPSQLPAECLQEEDPSGTVTISSGDSSQEQLVTRKDNSEEANQNLNCSESSHPVDNRESPHVPVDKESSEGRKKIDEESNSSRPDKSKLDESVPEKEGEQQTERASEKEGVDQSEDLLDQQKTSEESTPMECGQTLVGEVSYRGSSRGTEVLDESAGEGSQHKDVETPSHASREEADKELPCVDEDGKEDRNADSRDSPVSPAESAEGSDKEMEMDEEGHKSCEEDDLIEQIEGRDTPVSPEQEVEEGEEEGEEEERKNEGEKTRAGSDTVADGKQQEADFEEPQESEEDEAVMCREKEESERIGDISDKKKSEPELNSKNIITELSLSEEITILIDKKSELEKINTADIEGQKEGKKDNSTPGEEMEINEIDVTVSKDVEEVEDANITPSEEQGKVYKIHVREGEEPQTIPGETLNKLQEHDAVASKSVQGNEEAKEAPNTTKDFGEVDKSPHEIIFESSVWSRTISEGDKEKSQQISQNREQLGLEKTGCMEVETNVEADTTSPKSSCEANETVVRPRMTIEAKVAQSRTIVQVKDLDNSLKKPAHIKETVLSPNCTVQAADTTPTIKRESKPSQNVSIPSTSEAVEQDESEPNVLQHTEKTAAEAAPEATTVNTSIPIEASEEPGLSTKQQEEELSPEKSSRSRLKLAVSTPERLKKRGTLMHAGSRAALLVACAKQNIKNRGGGEAESPSILTDGRRSRSLGPSPTTRSAPNRPSPGHSPDSRRHSLLDSVGMRPWMKHSPSPGASPSTSILKRTLNNDGLDGDAPSPPLTKYRRVSFADPPVSERVEIPPSPRTLKSIRAQKRLDMTRMASPVKNSDPQRAESQVVSQEANPEVLDWNHPIFPALLTCQDKVDQVAQHLTSPAMLPGLLFTLEEQGVHTVGQLSKLTEWDINSLPVKAPKVINTFSVLREYEKTQQRENSATSPPVMDEIEASLAKMFGELDRDDKENLQPNQQDCVADHVAETEAEVRENAGRSSHTDDIQEIMEMEEITPLYSGPEETEPETLKTLYRRVREQDVASQKKLLRHLLMTLPLSDVAEAFAECIKSRMVNATKTTTTTTT